MARTKPASNPSKPPTIPSPSAPQLTQENFEKELLALKAKAQDETWSKYLFSQILILIQSGLLLTLAAVSANVSELALSPVYGSYSASTFHSKLVMTACFAGWSGNLFLRRRLNVKPALLMPVVATYIPFLQFFLFKISGSLGAYYGPVITEILTLLPLVVLSVSCTATTLEGLEMSLGGRAAWLTDSAPGVLSYGFFKTVEFFSLKFIIQGIGNSFVQTRLGLQIVLAGIYGVLNPSKLLLWVLPAVLHTAFWNTHVPYGYTTDLLNGTMHSNGWNLLERRESITGYISILESREQGYRVMRCDHSLLGGEWLRSEKNHNQFPEPIYAIFIQLEALRLVEVPVEVPDHEAEALVIGLGIGTLPSAFIEHGISTTIVEIDPVVHEFATRYFALPKNHTPVIQDAVVYASVLAASPSPPQFDYIVHDVFTGGAEPVELFTLEFLQDLRSILKPDGVIALNYATDILLPSSRIILLTILTVFPNCRIYREHAAPSATQLATDNRDFTNLMFFCSKPDSKITFRTPRKSDFLGSKMREMTLVPRFEVPLEAIGLKDGNSEKEKGEVLLKNGTEGFKKWQFESARGHWAVMRGVLPEWVWVDW